MCGIIGAFTYTKAEINLDLRTLEETKRHLVSETLMHMLPRGKDSTGIAILRDDKEWSLLKQAVPSPEFLINDNLYEKRISDNPEACFHMWANKWVERAVELDSPVRQIIGHVRAGTQGFATDPHNNHPLLVPNIKNPGIIFVHNGGIKNDYSLFNKKGYTRIGSVDSEIIGHLINEYKDDLSIENLESTFKQLEGAYTVLAFNPNNPTRVVGTRTSGTSSGRPLDAAWFNELGTLILVSERKYLEEAVAGYERWRVRENKVEDFPYLVPTWYEALPQCVFTLSLDQELPAKITPAILIEKKTMESTVHTSEKIYGAKVYDAYSNKYKNTTTNAIPSIIPAKPIVNKTVVEDLTDYDSKPIALPASTDDGDNIILENYHMLGAMNQEEDDDSSEVTETYLADEHLDWENLIEEGQTLLLADTHISERLAIHGLDQQQAETILKDRCAISGFDKEEAICMVTNLYGEFFPEGYATGYEYGYAEGYVTAQNENQEDEETESKALAAKKEAEIKIKTLDAELAQAMLRITELKAKLTKTNAKKVVGQGHIEALKLALEAQLRDNGLLENGLDLTLFPLGIRGLIKQLFRPYVYETNETSTNEADSNSIQSDGSAG